MTKHIFITGGVVSSLGKGLTAASIGMLLEERGLTIRMQKLDPYLNVLVGTMSHTEHGEVFRLEDGTCGDIDLSYYKRFTKSPLTKDSSVSAGLIYKTILQNEEAGQYGGKTIQIIPHVTDEIKRRIRKLTGDGVDVVITEIGGTVGDIEGLPFLEAIRQLSLEEECIFVHLALIPHLKMSDELKTKPVQHSVERLRQIGIQPDIIICRTEKPLTDIERSKIGLFCNIRKDYIIEAIDCTMDEVPVNLKNQGVDSLICEKLSKI